LAPISKLVEQIIFVVILALFANFEAENAQNGPKKKNKTFFSNMNQNKLYFPILVLDQQVVKISSPYCAINIFSTGRGCLYLDHQRTHFVIMF
jgi:hypothetical protein